MRLSIKFREEDIQATTQSFRLGILEDLHAPRVQVVVPSWACNIGPFKPGSVPSSNQPVCFVAHQFLHVHKLCFDIYATCIDIQVEDTMRSSINGVNLDHPHKYMISQVNHCYIYIYTSVYIHRTRFHMIFKTDSVMIWHK